MQLLDVCVDAANARITQMKASITWTVAVIARTWPRWRWWCRLVITGIVVITVTWTIRRAWTVVWHRPDRGGVVVIARTVSTLLAVQRVVMLAMVGQAGTERDITQGNPDAGVVGVGRWARSQAEGKRGAGEEGNHSHGCSPGMRRESARVQASAMAHELDRNQSEVGAIEAEQDWRCSPCAGAMPTHRRNIADDDG